MTGFFHNCAFYFGHLKTYSEKGSSGYQTANNSWYQKGEKSHLSKKPSLEEQILAPKLTELFLKECKLEHRIRKENKDSL